MNEFLNVAPTCQLTHVILATWFEHSRLIGSVLITNLGANYKAHSADDSQRGKNFTETK